MGTGERFCGLENSPISFLFDGMANHFCAVCTLSAPCLTKFPLQHHRAFWVFDPENEQKLNKLISTEALLSSFRTNICRVSPVRNRCTIRQNTICGNIFFLFSNHLFNQNVQIFLPHFLWGLIFFRSMDACCRKLTQCWFFSSIFIFQTDFFFLQIEKDK